MKNRPIFNVVSADGTTFTIFCDGGKYFQISSHERKTFDSYHSSGEPTIDLQTATDEMVRFFIHLRYPDAHTGDNASINLLDYLEALASQGIKITNFTPTKAYMNGKYREE